MRAVLKGLLFGLFAMTLNHAALAAGGKGSADEAIALVKKAANYLKNNDKEKAYAEFDNNKGQFIDRDLYIFVFDMSGKTLAHGTNPRLLGKNMIDLKDADGKYFVRSFIEVANTKGKGWIDYKWTNPVSKAIEQKSSYIEKVGDVLVGCGIYK